nr:MAG TPA: hypothetical protein [Caudoviricetes sp.]
MENSINLTVELSEPDKALLGKLLSAVEALNASLLANQGMIAIADTDTPTEGASRPDKPPVAEPVKDIDPNAGAAVVALGDVQRKVVELCGPAHGKKAEVREIIKAYAPKVTGIPVDKLDEVMAKLMALEG